MEYSNSEIPEGINSSEEHPLKEFSILGAGIIGLVVLFALLVSFAAELVAPYIPFEYEQDLAAGFVDLEADERPVVVYLQNLKQGLEQHMDLDEGMTVTLHYVDDGVENAFATLGGHIYIHRGLLESMSSENALSMVIAHEIAHVQHRHPIKALGRGAVIGLFLAALTGLSGDRFVGSIVNSAGVLTVLGFSRDQESQADETALAAVNAYYGHVNGASDLFRTFLKHEQQSAVKNPQFLSTHPLSTGRISAMEELALDKGWSTDGETIPLPDGLISDSEQDGSSG